MEWSNSDNRNLPQNCGEYSQHTQVQQQYCKTSNIQDPGYQYSTYAHGSYNLLAPLPYQEPKQYTETLYTQPHFANPSYQSVPLQQPNSFSVPQDQYTQFVSPQTYNFGFLPDHHCNVGAPFPFYRHQPMESQHYQCGTVGGKLQYSLAPAVAPTVVRFQQGLQNRAFEKQENVESLPKPEEQKERKQNIESASRNPEPLSLQLTPAVEQIEPCHVLSASPQTPDEENQPLLQIFEATVISKDFSEQPSKLGD
ncbi:uncharacterized protein [Watersipora subatra]|uniref:uncharacterized protein n=1 Tax=Watersipora subatra TaxID=2589382 RepID=UPI00355B0C77